ncbi:MAG: hypothetical protein RL757_620 [Bacteroidota bacterium]
MIKKIIDLRFGALLSVLLLFSSCDALLFPVPTTPTKPTGGGKFPNPNDPLPTDPKPTDPKPDKSYSQHGVKPPSSAEAASLRVVDMDGVECDLMGNAKREGDRGQNMLKNRYTFPKDSDFDPNFSLEAALETSDLAESERFSASKAGVLRGYVFEVKGTDAESCNCSSTNKKYQDVHIVITPNEKQTAKKYHVVIEITPRMAMFMEKRQVDWSLATLKGLKGYYVEVKGWLFYDRIHESESFANDPDDNSGRKNWRGTAWELHPVTDLRFIKE